jgi:alkanesulfonate monooxygenase SsuD/methylene tetrahydromethanopterin reductase-like flavin-dependent oxidoreductase (luciferase family)
VKLGVTLPQFTGDPHALLRSARRAAAAGLDSVWVFDHLWPLSGGKERPILECWSTLAWIAGALEEKVIIGTLVTRSSLRNPALLARMAATVADMAPGRVIVGIGSGDAASRPENEAFGIPYWEGEERHDQLFETAAAVRAHLAGRAPVWIGGRSRAIRRAAGRVADAWNGWGGTPERFARDAREVKGARLTWGGLAVLASTDTAAAEKAGKRNPAEYVIGGPARLAGHLAGIAAAGAEHAVITFPDAAASGPYELLGGEVRSKLDAARRSA